jgi:putative ABC transport system substrate-binding protein
MAGLGLLAGCVSWSPPGQQPAKLPHIGYLDGLRIDDPLSVAEIKALRQGLHELGYTEGQNVIIEWRSTEGNLDRLPEAAAELVRLPVNVLVVTGPPTIRAAQQATTTIPIVMTVGDDPVRLGLVASLARPGSNITGLASWHSALSEKRVELLKATFPEAARLGVLGNPDTPSYAPQLEAMQRASGVLGMQIKALELRKPDDLDGAFAVATREQIAALLTVDDAVSLGQRARIIDFASSKQLPSMSSTTDAGVGY